MMTASRARRLEFRQFCRGTGALEPVNVLALPRLRFRGNFVKFTFIKMAKYMIGHAISQRKKSGDFVSGC
jgi:hypothetical protein